MKKLSVLVTTSALSLSLIGCKSQYYATTLVKRDGEFIPASKISRTEEFMPILYSSKRLPKRSLSIKSDPIIQERYNLQIIEEYDPTEKNFPFSYFTTITETNFAAMNYSWNLTKNNSLVEHVAYTFINGLIYQASNRSPLSEDIKTRSLWSEKVTRE